MTGFLDVDVDVLTKTVQALRGVEQVLTDVMKEMAEVGVTELGTQVLDSAADSFQRRWKFGLERIGDSAATTADGVDQCLTAYRELDTTMATLLGIAGVGLGSPVSTVGADLE